MMLFMVVLNLSCRVDLFYYGMQHYECMISYMSIYVTCMYHCSMFGYILVLFVACIILASSISSIVHSFLIICSYAYVQLVTYFLCMFMFACGQVYNDVVVVVLHEVVVCVFVKVMH